MAGVAMIRRAIACHLPGETPASPAMATLARPAVSPSGTWVVALLSETAGDSTVFRVRVSDTAGHTVLAPTDAWAARHRTLAGWDEGVDRVWVYSGDVGTQTWTANEAGWVSQPWAGSGLTAPSWLRERVPRVFQ